MTNNLSRKLSKAVKKPLYDGYEVWKGWDESFLYTAEQAQYFAGECRNFKISNGDVLEIGFGSGSFLAWSRELGARVVGTEIDPKLLDAARKFGLEILPAEFELVAEDHVGRFHTIAAFDVFEHFTIDEIIIPLRAIETMLLPGGHLLLRFPNG